MIFRVTLYAEGAGEVGGSVTGLPPPTEPLQNGHLGPANILMRRSLEHVTRIPANAVQFDSPLLTARGRIARGSDLRDRATLRQLLTWFEGQPDLAIVLIDTDGDQHRKRMLEGYTSDLPVSKIIAAATNEFEAWLAADQNALNSILGSGLNLPGGPESLDPGRVKEILANTIRRVNQNERDVRVELAVQSDLNTIKTTCRSFELLLQDLRRVTKTQPG